MSIDTIKSLDYINLDDYIIVLNLFR